MNAKTTLINTTKRQLALFFYLPLSPSQSHPSTSAKPSGLLLTVGVTPTSGALSGSLVSSSLPGFSDHRRSLRQSDGEDRMGMRGLTMAKRLKCLALPRLFSRPSPNRFVAVRSMCSASSPDVARLAKTARISLTPTKVEEFAPKIRQVVDWFGQLQAVDLESVEPSIRADTEGDNLREDVPQTFDNREAMIGGVPKYDEPYIRVPKVLNNE